MTDLMREDCVQKSVQSILKLLQEEEREGGHKQKLVQVSTSCFCYKDSGEMKD